jgi:hypothetical protein
LVAFGGARIDAEDVILRRVAPSRWGYGIGAGADGDGVIVGRRLAVEDAAGAALVASVSGETAGASLDLEDVLVRRVSTSTLVPPGETPLAVASYGVHAGPGCALAARRARVQDAGYGFFVADGSLSLASAIVARQADAAGARAGDAVVLSLVDVGYAENATDDVVSRDSLPVAASLPAPTRVCTGADCP